MTNQPDTLEVGSTMYDCGECGYSFLERVFWYPGGGRGGDWLTCPNCDWSEAPDDCGLHGNEWYQELYKK